MIKVYTIGLTSKHTNGSGQWDGIVAEIKNINPDKIFCIGMEEALVNDWFDNQLFDKLLSWLEEHNKFVHIIGGFANQVIKCYPPRIQARIIHEESLGCMLWASNILYSRHRKALRLEKTPKLFTCYNNNHKLPRALLVDELARYNLIKDGIVTLHNPDLYRNTDGSKYVWKYHDGSALIDEENFSLATHGGDIIPKSFNQGFFDIVTETWYDTNQFFITEKTLKSIAMAKPFIALSCKGYHTYLRDKFGFELYDELFDYSFDQCDKIEDRVEGIIHNVLNLKNRLSSESKKANLFKIIKSKLYRNLERREAITWNTDMIVPASLKFLLEDNPYILYGEQKIALLGQIEQILNKNGRDLNWAIKI